MVIIFLLRSLCKTGSTHCNGDNIMQRKAFAILLIAFFIWVGQCQAEENITIGVLAHNGSLKAMKQWAATGIYLTTELEHPTTIIPISSKEILPAIEKQNVNFFIVDPSFFITASIKYAAAPVVTMKKFGGWQALTSSGAVLFTAAENKNIHSLSDLQGKTFGAVQRSSFSGWQMAQKEFTDNDINIYDFVSTLRFFATHEKVIKAVLNKQVDAGTVAAGVLEQMVTAGNLTLEQVKILQQKEHPDFPFHCSTALYPEWVLARTASTSPELTIKIAEALQRLSAEDIAAKDAGIIGWGEPADYSSVEELQQELKIGAYKP